MYIDGSVQSGICTINEMWSVFIEEATGLESAYLWSGRGMMMMSSQSFEERESLVGVVEELLAVAGLGVCYQALFAYIPGKHVSSIVVYAWEVSGCDSWFWMHNSLSNGALLPCVGYPGWHW